MQTHMYSKFEELWTLSGYIPYDGSIEDDSRFKPDTAVENLHIRFHTDLALSSPKLAVLASEPSDSSSKPSTALPRAIIPKLCPEPRK